MILSLDLITISMLGLPIWNIHTEKMQLQVSVGYCPMGNLERSSPERLMKIRQGFACTKRLYHV